MDPSIHPSIRPSLQPCRLTLPQERLSFTGYRLDASNGAVFPSRVPTPQLPLSASTALVAEPAASARERQRRFEQGVPSLIVHNLKQPRSVEYVSRVLQRRTELDTKGCEEALRYST